MRVDFRKYQATGNDFVMLDNRAGEYSALTTDQVAFICSRRFGVGADGLILLQNHTSYDFEMVYYNSDGNQSTMCGNGGRCIVRFAHDLGVIGDEATFLAIDGEHKAKVTPDVIHLQMIDVPFVEGKDAHDFLDTGSPHHVDFVEDVMNYPIVAKGREIRNSTRYEPIAGTNVNFVTITDGGIKVRTYERGVEDETYSCGTGVTACALLSSLKGYSSPVPIYTKGGELSVSFERNDTAFHNVWLNGPAKLVFSASIEV
ncbi:MAG: diaminopimelate epimerase [Cyclobacteriaceae bacterium]